MHTEFFTHRDNVLVIYHDTSSRDRGLEKRNTIWQKFTVKSMQNCVNMNERRTAVSLRRTANWTEKQPCKNELACGASRIYLFLAHGIFILTVITDDNTPLTFILLMIFDSTSWHDDVTVRIWALHVFKFALFNMILWRKTGMCKLHIYCLTVAGISKPELDSIFELA